MSKRNFLLALTAFAFAITMTSSATGATPATVFAAGATFNINVTCQNGTHEQKSVQQSSSTVANINVSCGGGGKGPKGDPGVPGRNGINGTNGKDGQRGPMGIPGVNGKDAPPATICIQLANESTPCPVVTINETSTNSSTDFSAHPFHPFRSSTTGMPIIPMIPN